MRTIAERLAYARMNAPKLNPLLFDEDSRLREPVKKKIQAIVDAFLEYSQLSDVRIIDIRLLGSNAAYNYTPESDLDIHIVTDLSEISDPELIARLYFDSVKKNFKDAYNIHIKGIEVEIYVEDINAAAISNGVYSITKDDWIKEPTPDSDPTESQLEKAERIEAGILAQIDAAKDMNELQKVVDNIYLIRKDSLAEEGENSAGNLAFKSLRNKGILDKIRTILKSSESKELSLENKKVF